MSTATDNAAIIDQLKRVVRARRESLVALRDRIEKLFEPIPVGAVLSDDHGEVCRIVRVCTGASQWSNRTWEVTIRGKGAITPGGKLLGDTLDDCLWDGSNMCYRRNEPTCRYRNGEPAERLAYEPGTTTRAYAARLPAAIARYIERCEAEAAANAATLSPSDA